MYALFQYLLLGHPNFAILTLFSWLRISMTPGISLPSVRVRTQVDAQAAAFAVAFSFLLWYSYDSLSLLSYLYDSLISLSSERCDTSLRALYKGGGLTCSLDLHALLTVILEPYVWAIRGLASHRYVRDTLQKGTSAIHEQNSWLKKCHSSYNISGQILNLCKNEIWAWSV